MNTAALLVYLILCAIFCNSVVVHAQTSCSCIGCQSISVGPYLGGRTITTSPACGSGQYAAVQNIQITTTNGDTFSVRTYNPDNSPFSFTAGTTTAPTSCFSTQPGVRMGAQQYSTITIAITCNNVIESCQLMYSASFLCVTDPSAVPAYSWVGGAWSACSTTQCAATGTKTREVTCMNGNTGALVSSTLCSDTKPMTITSCTNPQCPNQPAPTLQAGCQCSCCLGNGCQAAYVGISNPTCDASDEGTCSQSTCRAAFPQVCPSAGMSGAVSSVCAAQSSIQNGPVNGGGGGGSSSNPDNGGGGGVGNGSVKTWQFYFLIVALTLVGLTAMCAGLGFIKMPPMTACANKWMIWSSIFVQLLILSMFAAAGGIDHWSQVQLDRLDQVGAHLYAGLLAFRGDVNGQNGISGFYTDMCFNSMIQGDVKKCCMTVAIGGIAVIVCGGVFAGCSLISLLLSTCSVFGKSNAWRPTHVSMIQCFVGCGVILAWSCAHVALEQLMTLFPLLSGGKLVFSLSWILALVGTVLTFPLSSIYALPKQPETILYQVFQNAAEEFDDHSARTDKQT